MECCWGEGVCSNDVGGLIVGRRNVKSGSRKMESWKGGGGIGRVGNFGRGEANEVRCEWVLLG